MRLLKVTTIENCLLKLKDASKNLSLNSEIVNIDDALGRTLFEDIISKENIPSFDRSVVDGYAVIAKDLFGASETIPTFLKITKNIQMGEDVDFVLKSGEAAYIPTGGMLPKNADAVVMIEYSEKLSEDEVCIYSPVAPLNGVMKTGDDIKIGEKILKRGLFISPQDIGVMAALGISKIKVFKRPKISIISTGDEVVSVDTVPKTGQVRDINGNCLKAFSKELGCEVVNHLIIDDEYDELVKKVSEVSNESDIVILSGGSSVGTKDLTIKILEEINGIDAFVHGLAIKPGKPTIISATDSTIFFGLPGHPASAIIVFLAVVKPYIKYLLNQEEKFQPYIEAILENNIHASEGKTVYQMVSLELKDQKYFAKAIYGKSGAISNLSKSDGFIIVPENSEGLNKNQLVKVYTY